MNPPYMILHIIHTTKNPPTPIPLTKNPRVMFRLVPGSVLLTREPPMRRLRTPIIATEEVFAVPVVVFPEIASSAEDRGR